MPDGPDRKTPTCPPIDDLHGSTKATDRNGLIHRRMQSIGLRVEHGPDEGREFIFRRDDDRRDENRITGGRSRVNDIVLSHGSISGSHFELYLERNCVRLRDLDSRNGTFVGAVRVKEALLTAGDAFSPAQECRIRIMNTESGVIPMLDDDHLGSLYGSSPAMREIFLIIKKIAQTPLSVLIEGETGTGKELVARALHEHSPRSGRFEVFDSTNLPRDLAESMIHGTVKGAFTGASDLPGAFERADRGTVFLDEIGELPWSLQPKLLRVLENSEVQRLGGGKTRKVDVRVIAATHRDLRSMVAKGTFREDLYYRLAASTIRLPALRDRGDDVIQLAQHFVDEACKEQGGKRVSLGRGAREWLLQEPWPGNVRQLRNVIRGAAYLGGSIINDKDLARYSKRTRCEDSAGETIFGMKRVDAVLSFKYRYVRHHLDIAGNNIAEAGRRTGYSRAQIKNILNDYEARFPSGALGAMPYDDD